MFSGEKLLEDLRSDNSLMKTMVDRFGEDVTDLYLTVCCTKKILHGWKNKPCWG